MKKKLLTLALLGVSVALFAGCVTKEEVVNDDTLLPVEEAVLPVVEEVMPTDEVVVEEAVVEETTDEVVEEAVAE
ncbi:hypothetical protein KKG31_04010 [Patescibacteria group bacterium]|nr:hypothetical protein [Patescibacteria group bacterium]MBU1758307.1 hypothetical protein [Patescibacteria group bacterium]